MRCWYARWQMSNALDRGDLASRMGRGHAASCASCQAFGHALESLDARLSLGARAAPAPAPVARRVRRPWLVAAPLAVGAAAAIVIAIGRAGGPIEPVTAVPPLAVPAPGSPISVSGVADRVSQVFAKTPLDTELENLLHDGKRGLDEVLAAGGLR
jgi:hypothetical protein